LWTHSFEKHSLNSNFSFRIWWQKKIIIYGILLKNAKILIWMTVISKSRSKILFVSFKARNIQYWRHENMVEFEKHKIVEIRTISNLFIKDISTQIWTHSKVRHWCSFQLNKLLRLIWRVLLLHYILSKRISLNLDNSICAQKLLINVRFYACVFSFLQSGHIEVFEILSTVYF
jgi:hypothetical protein